MEKTKTYQFVRFAFSKLVQLIFGRINGLAGRRSTTENDHGNAHSRRHPRGPTAARSRTCSDRRRVYFFTSTYGALRHGEPRDVVPLDRRAAPLLQSVFAGRHSRLLRIRFADPRCRAL